MLDTEINTSLLEDLDFPIACESVHHETSKDLHEGDAKWYIDMCCPAQEITGFRCDKVVQLILASETIDCLICKEEHTVREMINVLERI